MATRRYAQRRRVETAEHTRRRILDAVLDEVRTAPGRPVSVDAVAQPRRCRPVDRVPGVRVPRRTVRRRRRRRLGAQRRRGPHGGGGPRRRPRAPAGRHPGGERHVRSRTRRLPCPVLDGPAPAGQHRRRGRAQGAQPQRRHEAPREAARRPGRPAPGPHRRRGRRRALGALQLRGVRPPLHRSEAVARGDERRADRQRRARAVPRPAGGAPPSATAPPRSRHSQMRVGCGSIVSRPSRSSAGVRGRRRIITPVWSGVGIRPSSPRPASGPRQSSQPSRS